MRIDDISIGGESASGLFVIESPDKLIDCNGAVRVDKSVVLLIKPFEESDIGSGCASGGDLSFEFSWDFSAAR